MSRDYRGIDWEESVPTDEEWREGLEACAVYVRALDRRLDPLVKIFHEDRTSAKLMVGQFDLQLEKPQRFYLSRNRIYETGWFPWFFNQPAVREALPDLGELYPSRDPPYRPPYGGQAGETLGLRLVDGWSAMATLAGRVSRNGVYMFEKRPTDRATVRIVLGFARAAFRAKPSEAVCHSTWEPWCDWFHGESEDTTLLCIDLARGMATVVMISDAP